MPDGKNCALFVSAKTSIVARTMTASSAREGERANYWGTRESDYALGRTIVIQGGHDMRVSLSEQIES